MTKLKFNNLVSLLRENYSGNKSYYESLFSILYFTDEDFVLEDFLKRRTKFRKEKNLSQLKQPVINHDNYVYTMNVFKNIFGKEFIKSKPLSFLDAFIVCCGDKTTTSSTDVKKILRKKLLTDFDTKGLYKKYECRFRSGFTKKKMRTFFENYNKPLEHDDDPLLIRFLCDYFNMNICIILPEEKDILFNSPRDKFSIYSPTMILEKFKDKEYQYLIMSNKETIFTSSSSFIYKLLNYKIMKDYLKYVENNEIYVKKVQKKSVNSHFIEEKQKKYNLIKFSAGGLRDFSRIAASNEIMWRDIFFNNKKNMISAINLFIRNLNLFKKDIDLKKNKQIIKKLIKTKKVRKQIIFLKQDTDKPDFGR